MGPTRYHKINLYIPAAGVSLWAWLRSCAKAEGCGLAEHLDPYLRPMYEARGRAEAQAAQRRERARVVVRSGARDAWHGEDVTGEAAWPAGDKP